MNERRTEIAELAARLPGRVALGVAGDDPLMPTGLPDLDERLGGLPRGRLSELVGPASSGKLSVLLSTLRRVLAPPSGEEPGLAALVDLSGTVFPHAAWASGRLLVVRPGELPDALRALDVLAASASFELVALEASGHLPARGLPEAVSVRLARLARGSGTVIVACAERSAFGALASLRLHLSGRTDGGLPHGLALALRALAERRVVPFTGRPERAS
jgi:hypothetical protein